VGQALRGFRSTVAPGVRLPSRVFAYGFSLNKRRILRRFAGDSIVHSVRNARRIPRGSALLLWGSTPVPPGLAADVKLIRVEDGFLRSVGLGAELARPVSWVLDHSGIYYDATRPSDLEQLLQSWEFTPQLLARAAALRERIVASGITKYSVGTGAWRRPQRARVILVPGQVESDASLRLGAPSLRTNLGLVRAVREANPYGYLLYKPHPDVAAGLRARGKDERQVRVWCDEVVTEVAMGTLLEQVDEVHVLTSLAGFEALLRGKLVVCHGRPFYAGWGLTQDVEPIARRQRQLTLDELVAGSLIVYPTYVSHRTGRYISAEQALDELLAWRESVGTRNRAWQQLRRAVLRLTVAHP
jgi:capsular polysaccharide export protein